MTQPTANRSPEKTKQKKEARDIRGDALKIANSIKINEQTPIETKAIANGIQRGMELFLRQQSEKTRNLDKRTKQVKKLTSQLTQQKPMREQKERINAKTTSRLPWVLLTISWGLFLLGALVNFYFNTDGNV